MHKHWHDEAWEEYLYWQTQDKKTLKKINALIKDIDRNGYQCEGKPEPLTGNRSGFWSVRIDKKNRIVFRIRDGELEIAQCGSHYREKIKMPVKRGQRQRAAALFFIGTIYSVIHNRIILFIVIFFVL